MQMSGIKLKHKLQKKATQTAKILDPKCLNEKQQRQKGKHTQDQESPGSIGKTRAGYGAGDGDGDGAEAGALRCRR